MLTPRTKIKRVPQRACYETEKIYNIIDASSLCQVAFETEEGANIIPTIHWRIGDNLYIHGSTKSRMIQAVQDKPVCISITIIDGLVLARSAFHHSMNYRSVIIYSQGILLTEPEEKNNASKSLVEKIMPKRWDNIRQPNAQELKATAIVFFPLNEASAKIREGGPKDDPEDMDYNTWAGEIPIVSKVLAPIRAHDSDKEIPQYIKEWFYTPEV